MARSSTTGRQRGEITALPSGSLRVKVYAGVDPVSGKRLYLNETVPPGRKAAKETERVRVRLLGQLDGKAQPKTRATVDQLLDRCLEVLDVEPTHAVAVRVDPGAARAPDPGASTAAEAHR